MERELIGINGMRDVFMKTLNNRVVLRTQFQK